MLRNGLFEPTNFRFTMKDEHPFYGFPNCYKRRNYVQDVNEKIPAGVYKAILKTQYVGKLNKACTCKLARFEEGHLKKYSFNQAYEVLQSWIDTCENEACFKEWFDTFQKCKCE